MNCPHCDSSLSHAAQSCAACGFKLTLLKPILGDQWVRLDRITDMAHTLRLSDARNLEVLLDDFERRFPQAFIAIYLGHLPRPLRPNALGFWLLNHGAFNTPQMAKRNDFGAVITVDYQSMECALSLGYALETLIDSKTLSQAVTKLAKNLQSNKVGHGLEGVIAKLSKALASKGLPEPRTPAHHQSSINSDIGLRTLRSGHRIDPDPLHAESTPETTTSP